MEPGKLFTLGGLATGGLSAVSGTATSLVGAGAFGGSMRTSSLIRDLGDNSTSLFQKTHQECIKGVFPKLGNLDVMRGDVNNTESNGTSFKLSNVTTPPGPVKGCLTVDLNYLEGGDKGALAATIEMAISKGDYGIILLNSIGNIFESGKYQFDYRAFFLKRQSDDWKIEAGLEWKDGMFVQSGYSLEKMVWSGLEGLNKSTLWKDQLCTSVFSCKAVESHWSNRGTYLKSFDWAPDASSGKNPWQGLEIKKPDSGSLGYEQDFWSGKETRENNFLDSFSTLGSGIFKDNKWQKPKASSTVDTGSIKSWLDIFKGDKGKWKERNS